MVWGREGPRSAPAATRCSEAGGRGAAAPRGRQARAGPAPPLPDSFVPLHRAAQLAGHQEERGRDGDIQRDKKAWFWAPPSETAPSDALGFTSDEKEAL